MTAKDMVKITVNLVVIYVIGGLIMAFVYAKTAPIMFIKAEEEKQAALKLMIPEADFINSIYQITDDSLESLRKAKVPNDVITQLKNLNKKRFIGKNKLLGFLQEKIGTEKSEKYKKDFLKSFLISDWNPHEKHAEYYIAQDCEEVKIKGVKDEKTGEMKEEKECLNPQDIGYIVEGFGKGYSSYIHVLASVDKNFIVQKISVLGHGETPGLGDEIEKDYFLNQFKGRSADNLVVIKGETPDKIQAITGATISSRAVTEDGVKNGVIMLKEKLSGEVEG
jgi:electron transport complex protein RnfG